MFVISKLENAVTLKLYLLGISKLGILSSPVCPLFRLKETKVTTNGGNLSLRWESRPLPALIRYGSSSDPLQQGQVDNPQQSLDNPQTPRACQVLGK